ncbi:hypothetical protein Cylst_2826 [Cylindrospermum stagnale PCC 7417]|uniref:Uncharacterized protein n=1 Tax=Cylindrospermum stagnale PCC 7417 TaxID=56107 RepID=K9WXC0_9NOST|nr:hypothetical protein Cylst_2826 [Cylindrospermum stagnale PCC 7417]
MPFLLKAESHKQQSLRVFEESVHQTFNGAGKSTLQTQADYFSMNLITQRYYASVSGQ